MTEPMGNNSPICKRRGHKIVRLMMGERFCATCGRDISQFPLVHVEIVEEPIEIVKVVEPPKRSLWRKLLGKFL